MFWLFLKQTINLLNIKTKITLGMFTNFLELLFTSYNDLITNASGSPRGRSSSMGDGGGSCGHQGYHGYENSTNSCIIITGSIPASGYMPGVTCKIETSAKFGFELAAENASNSSAGKFKSVDSGSQILTNGDASHNSTGNTSVIENFEWQVN